MQSYRVLTSAEDIVSIKTEWDRLWVDARAGYQLSFSYVYQSWTTIHSPQRSEFCCVVAYQNGRLVAALPMVLLRGKIKLWKYAAICSPDSAEDSDMLIERSGESQAIATGLLEKFLTFARPDVVKFFFVKSGCHLDTAIRRLTSLRLVDSFDNVIPYADLKAEVDWESYKRSLSKHYESNLARKTRRLHEQGKITVEIVRDTPGAAIEWLFEHKRKWSERTQKRGHWVFSPRYQEFINNLFAADSRFLVFALKLDNEPIAMKLAGIGSGFAGTMMISYDDKYERFSPGNILDEFMMRHIFENYRDYDGRHLDIDFGPGQEHFKLHWSRGNLHPARSFILAASGAGFAKLRFDQTRARLQQFASTLPRRLRRKSA
jgi:CelD/BcsL family acetyltransferase involved in cellulose biosynthesis